jgi:hypothetical protein
VSKYFLFLEEASQDTFLAIIRKEVEPDKKDPAFPEVKAMPEVESDDSDGDAGAGDSEPDESMEEDVKEAIEELGRIPKKAKRPTKKNSKSLVALIKKYEPRMECSTDTNCLQAYTMNNIKLLQVTYGDKDGLAEFANQLKKLQLIVKALYQFETSTLRGAFVTYTGIFKQFYVKKPYKEDPKEGVHMKVVRNVLHADKSAVIAYLQEKEKRLTDRLKDKFVVDYDDYCRKIMKMHTIGTTARYKKDSVQLLLCIMGCIGCRKGALTDPNCEFYTYDEYQEILEARGEKHDTLRIGTWKSPTEFDEEHSFEVESKDAYKKYFHDYKYTIVQKGVLKDSLQSINKYLLDKDDERYVEDKLVIKPSIILTAKQVVSAIKLFREVNGINKESFKDRRSAAARFSTREIKPLIKEYFPVIFAQSARSNFEIGSHLMRKIFTNASYAVYEDRIKLVTGKYVDKSVWASNVLAHSGSLATSLSYANVHVKFGFDKKVFEIPKEELLRNIIHENEEVARKNEEFKKEILLEVKKMGVEVPEDGVFVDFKNTDGLIVKLRKHRKQRYRDEEDEDAAVRDAIEQLHENKVSVTSNNIKKLGFGRKVIQQFTRRHPREMKSSPDEVEPVERKEEQKKRALDNGDGLDSKHEDPEEEPKAKKAKKAKPVEPVAAPDFPLPHGKKVIAPQHGSIAAQKEALRRDKIKFGEENVLLKPEDCTGTIEKNVLLAKKLTRDLCVE